MTNFWKIIAALALVVLGVFLGKVLWQCGDVPEVAQIKKEAEQKIKMYQDSIFIRDNILADLRIDNFNKEDSIVKLNSDYAKFRQRPISLIKADSLTRELNRKGREAFGNDGNNSQTTTALVFGNQFADNNGILKKQLANQKAQVVVCNGIIVYKDTIINVQAGAIQDLTIIAKKERRKGIFQGIGIGAAIVGAAVLLL